VHALAEQKLQWVTVSRALDDAWGGVEVLGFVWGVA
jgi:hypothetical protein